MALAFKSGQLHSTTTNAASYALTGLAPAVGDLIVVAIVAGATAAAPGLTDNQSGTYYLAASQSIGGDLHCIFVRETSVATTGSHQLTFTCTGDNADGVAAYQALYTGAVVFGAAAVRQTGNGSGAGGATPSATAAAATLTDNAILASIGNSSNPATLTAPGSFSERYDGGYNTPTTGLEVATRDSGHTSDTVTWGSTSGSAWGTLFVELTATISGSSSTTNADDTSAATGLETVTGSSSTTNANDTSAATGAQEEPGVTGTLATTNANDTLAAAGLETLTGTLATTNADDTLAAAGLETLTGTLATTNANDTLAATGLETITGSLAASNGGAGGSNGPTDYTALFDPTEPGGWATSGSDITDLYDLSGNGLHLTQTTAGLRPQVDTLSGGDAIGIARLSGDYLTSDTISGVTSYFDNTGMTVIARCSIATPVYTDETANPTQLITLVSDGNIGSFDGTMSIGFREHTTNGPQAVIGWYGTDFNPYFVASTAQWAVSGFIVATWDGTSLKVRWNKEAFSVYTPPVSLGAVSGDLNLGYSTGLVGYQGQIREVVTFNYALTAEEADGVLDDLDGVAAPGAGDTLSASALETFTGTLATTNADDTSAATGAQDASITASSSTTNANDTSAASGEQAEAGVTGTLATTNAADTVAAAGLETVLASSSTTNAADAVAAAGLETVLASSSTTNAADTLAATGLETVLASSSTTNAADTSAATGAQDASITASLATTNAADTVAAAGLETVLASSSTTNAADTSAATGAQDASITASLATTNAADTLAATGLETVLASSSTTNAADTSAATGAHTEDNAVTGTLATTNAADTAVATGLETALASSSTTNAADTLAATGLETFTGTLATTNADDTSAATGAQDASITASLATTNAADTVVGSGALDVSISGTLASTNAADTVAAAGLETVLASSSTTNAADTTAGAGLEGFSASAGITEGTDAALAAAVEAFLGSLATTNAADTLFAYEIIPARPATARARSWHAIAQSRTWAKRGVAD